MKKQICIWVGFCGSISSFSTTESFAATGYKKLEFGELSQELQFPEAFLSLVEPANILCQNQFLN